MSYASRNTNQESDVLFIMTESGGDIEVEGGITTMTAMYGTMITLALAGGNNDDDGTPATKSLQWPGNEDEPEINKYRGRFHRWTQGRSINTGNLTEVQKDASDDLSEAFVDIAKEVTVSARLISSRSVKLTIDIIDKIGNDFRYIKEFGK